jgi:Tat protein translocase TatB subunit
MRDTILAMLDVGGPEFLLLIVLALLVFGPRRLPRIGRDVGAQVIRFRRTWEEFRRELEREVTLEDLEGTRRDVEELRAEFRREAAGSVSRKVGEGAPAADERAEISPTGSTATTRPAGPEEPAGSEPEAEPAGPGGGDASGPART